MNQNSVCVDIMLSFGRVGLGCEGCSAAGTSPCKGNHHKGDWGLILHQWCWILPCRAGSCPCFCSRVSPGHLPTPRVSLWMVAHTSLTPGKCSLPLHGRFCLVHLCFIIYSNHQSLCEKQVNCVRAWPSRAGLSVGTSPNISARQGHPGTAAGISSL